MATTNTTMSENLPPLPEYTLHPVQELVPGVPDEILKLILIPVIYWASSLLFHLFDALDLFPQYRIHTLEEISTRNRVTKWQVVRGVLIQQVSQTCLGLFAISRNGPKISYVGREEFDVALWAQSLRLWQKLIPTALAAVGVDANGLAKRVAGHYPIVADALLGGQYGYIQDVPAFTSWEIAISRAIYWVGVPVSKFAIAIFVVDLWQYVVHRLMHTNKFLYSRVHSIHHRLYVPFAFGALYNHPFEGFLLDTLGAIIAAAVARLSVRQDLLFLAISTVKTIDDHSGYEFPWDPLQLATPNNALYHDIHHQNWGIKTNFSQPYFIFWDRWLGTEWKGDTTALRSRNATKAKKDMAEKNKSIKSN